MIGLKEYKIRITFTEEALGSLPGDGMLYNTFIASKAPSEEKKDEEVTAFSAQELIDKGTTCFLMVDGHPCIYDYHLKGYFKDSMKAMGTVEDSNSSKISAYKKTIDNNVFVSPRIITLMKDGEPLTRKDMGICQRPLRASTPQGERVALASSETVPAGTYFDVTIQVLGDKKYLDEAILECLDYGQFKGLLQWRNSGKGRFTWKFIDD